MNVREELIELLDGKAGYFGIGKTAVVLHGKMEVNWFIWAIPQPWFKSWIKRKFPHAEVE